MGDKNLSKKNILITGKNSYIGESVEKWLLKDPDRYIVNTLDMISKDWMTHDFSTYDVIFHVAGIAHADVGKATDEQKKLYYKVNTELAVKVAEKAKESGVTQFIFMSSMIIYSGCKDKVIRKGTCPEPLNFYGDSKWQADIKIRKLETENFKVVVLRPPMIYGKGSRGNFPELVKLATKLPVFPKVKNKRSMLYIDNLCEFIKLIIDNGDSGIYFPQNSVYSNTSEIVNMIAHAKHHKIVMIPCMNVFIKVLFLFPGKIGKLAEKAFGDLTYEMSMSKYKESYQTCGLEKSIEISVEND